MAVGAGDGDGARLLSGSAAVLVVIIKNAIASMASVFSRSGCLLSVFFLLIFHKEP